MCIRREGNTTTTHRFFAFGGRGFVGLVAFTSLTLMGIKTTIERPDLWFFLLIVVPGELLMLGMATHAYLLFREDSLENHDMSDRTVISYSEIRAVHADPSGRLTVEGEKGSIHLQQEMFIRARDWMVVLQLLKERAPEAEWDERARRMAEGRLGSIRGLILFTWGMVVLLVVCITALTVLA